MPLLRKNKNLNKEIQIIIKKLFKKKKGFKSNYDRLVIFNKTGC